MDATATGGARRLLEIYVAPGCLGYETARRLAARVRRLGLATLDVRLVDLAEPGAIRPPAVFAVPTYLLDGRVLSLGNPFEDWLIDRLRQAVAVDGALGVGGADP
jgi:hypothetical protein